MDTVEAVKSQAEIDLITKYLRKYSPSDIYADIWKFGLNVALRISDLLSIRYDDLDIENRILVISEQKTGKKREIRLNTTALEIINKRKNDNPNDDYLFEVHSNRAKGKPVSRVSVARKFKEVGETMDMPLGTHSMRKTRGYMLYNSGKSIEMICRVLNHSSPAVTMRYLGITRDEVLATYDDYEL